LHFCIGRRTIQLSRYRPDLIRSEVARQPVPGVVVADLGTAEYRLAYDRGAGLGLSTEQEMNSVPGLVHRHHRAWGSTVRVLASRSGWGPRRILWLTKQAALLHQIEQRIARGAVFQCVGADAERVEPLTKRFADRGIHLPERRGKHLRGLAPN